MGSLAGPLFYDAEYGLHVSRMLAHAGHRLYWYDTQFQYYSLHISLVSEIVGMTF